MPDRDARHIGDGIQRTRRTIERNAEITRAWRRLFGYSDPRKQAENEKQLSQLSCP
jgi:hypothetical protein